ncbi:DUF2779 domain-containing protein [Longilinea arvoryzae]|nr:DUF2779 domain-containing protein [Longilinea arvoryzae]
MIQNENSKLTKSDFLLFCEAPRHLWAKKNNSIEQTLSDFDRHLIDEGYVVESLAREYLESVFLPENPRADLIWQKTFRSGPFETRIDVLIYWPDTDSYDLYEIKSATKPDRKDLYDVAFQVLILKEQIDLKHSYLLHLNKEYIRSEELDLPQVLVAEDVTQKIDALLPEVTELRRMAVVAANATDPNALPHCLSPRDCPCLAVCHPNLPDFSIYDIPYLSQKNKSELLRLGIREAKAIPETFGLNPKQRLIVERAQTNRERIDQKTLRGILDHLEFPLWFLDYETCIQAVPRYAGYHPQQQVVFQYSLHQLDELEGNLQHSGYISITEGDPSKPLLEHLSTHLGRPGTVIVWNKTFEMTRNKEMACLYPEFASFLEDVNARIYDIGEIVNQGIYLHPGFKGSWSIKNVLPIMAPELSYQGLPIHQGDQASMAWWNITFSDLQESQKKTLVDELEEYCALDTLAMVEIYRKLRSLA